MSFHQLDCNLLNALQVFESMQSRLELDEYSCWQIPAGFYLMPRKLPYISCIEITVLRLLREESDFLHHRWMPLV